MHFMLHAALSERKQHCLCGAVLSAQHIALGLALMVCLLLLSTAHRAHCVTVISIVVIRGLVSSARIRMSD